MGCVSFNPLRDNPGATCELGSDVRKLRRRRCITLASVGIVHGCLAGRLLVTNDKRLSCRAGSRRLFRTGLVVPLAKSQHRMIWHPAGRSMRMYLLLYRLSDVVPGPVTPRWHHVL